MTDPHVPCEGCTRSEACELIERCLDKKPLHDDYKKLDLSQIASVPPDGRGPKLEPCPVCGSEAELWQYSESETDPRQLVVMCSHGDEIGPQDHLVGGGCLLYMPPQGFYRQTIRDAVRYWNEFAKALNAFRRENNWKTAQVLRERAAGLRGDEAQPTKEKP